MVATADYAAATAMLRRPLPAYVSYTVHSHMKFDAIVRDQTTDMTVRTSDGTVVKGSVPTGFSGAVHVGDGSDAMEPVMHPAFRVRCYAAQGASRATFEGRSVEALALTPLCTKDKSDRDFDTLYVDPQTHQPIAAVGNPGDDKVSVSLMQRFAATGDRVMPSTLYVRVHGTGMMFWLDVLVDQRYENYRFSATP